MTLYRGPGGTGSATSDADTSLYQQFLDQTEAARDAALQAETNAETAETNAETAETNAETAATNAASSASAAATSASNASTSASNASSSASAAATSASNAAASATEAANTLASTVKLTGDQTIAGTKTFTSTISGSINGNAATVTNGVYTAGDQTIGGTKTFSSTITGSISGNAGTVTNGVYTTGSYADPTWITSIVGSKVTGNISGNAATATTATNVSGGTASVTTLTTSSTVTHNGGTANGVAYLNGSKVLTTGSALTFDGTNLGIGTSSPSYKLSVNATDFISSKLNTSYSGANYLVFADATTTGIGPFVGSVGNNLTFGRAGVSEYMRIDSNGQLGVGFTPLSTQGNLQVYKAISGGAPATSGTTDANQVFAVNYSSVQTSFGAYANGAAWIQQRAGGNFAVNYDLVLQPNGGNVGIGTSSIQGKFNVASGRSFFGANSETYSVAVGFTQSRVASGQVYYIGATDSATPDLVFSNSAGTERARITSGGDLLVGTTSATLGSGTGLKVVAGTNAAERMEMGSSITTNTAVGYSMYSTGASAYRFYVGYGGTIYATSTTITAISDQRLKENIQDLDVGLEKIMALKPRKFDWKSGKGKDKKGDRGWIAQEFEQVFPDMIDTWADPAPEGEEPYKAVNADLIPVLVKAIQEQQAIINQLTARIEALEQA